MKYLSIITIAISILLFSNTSYACSMYKITQGGKTIVGNNEDWLVANSEIWFTPKGNELYGVMNVGFDNDFAQGAINEAGLMFDGFAMPYLKVKNTIGKRKVPLAELIAPIMHNYSTVKEVKAHLSKINLSILDKSMLVFVDSNGDYLIVEGEALILGNNAEKSFSNFYPSQTPNPEKVNIGFYQNGLKHLKTTESEASLDYCSSVMNNFQQFVTQYTTIYDLQERKIRLHHYQDFENFIELDLVEELKKGAHKLSIPDLFPKNTKGYQYYETYNDAEAVVEYYKTLWKNGIGEKDGKPMKLPEAGMTQILNVIAGDWIITKKDYKGAITIFQLLVELFPESHKGYDNLGYAYLKDTNYEQAILNYNKSLALNPKNKMAKKMIRKIRKKR